MPPFLRMVRLAVLAAAALMASAQETRYVLAPTILLGDPAPDAFAGPGGQGDLDALNGAFRHAFEAAFPTAHVPLDLEHRLDPDEPTLAVVPRLSVVRVNQDVVAGTLERYEAVIVGDITLVDPWSLSRLFAATRMATRAVELSRDRPQAEKDALVRKAFNEATRAWIQDCLAEISRNAHPFTLKGRILDSPGVRVKGGGGIWPFGRLEGVKPSTPVSGPRHVKVREVFDHFSVLEATAKKTMSLDSAEEYHATMVGSDSAAERAEPRVALRWVGPVPGALAPGMKAPLDEAGWCGLMANYLGKSGGLRMLPLDAEEGQQNWRDLADLFKSFSMRNKADDDNDLGVSVQRSREAPDVVVDIGMPDACYGTAPAEKGATDNRFNVIWGVRWAQRQGDLDAAGRATQLFKGVEFMSEHKLFRTKPGMRELDLSSLWFNLCRDGLIKLARAVEAGIRPSEKAHVGLAKGGGQVAWNGAPPPPNTTLKWRKFQGQVRGPGGRDLGTYYSRPESLAVADLGRCDAQDELSYNAGSSGPLVVVVPPEVQPGSWLQAPWAQARLAAQVARLAPMEIMVVDDPSELPMDSAEPKFLKLFVEGLSAEAAGPVAKLGGVWRLRLYPKETFPGGEPLVKVGLKYAHSNDLLAAPYLPGDFGAAELAYQVPALDELLKTATAKGLSQAFH